MVFRNYFVIVYCDYEYQLQRLCKLFDSKELYWAFFFSKFVHAFFRLWVPLAFVQMAFIYLCWNKPFQNLDYAKIIPPYFPNPKETLNAINCWRCWNYSWRVMYTQLSSAAAWGVIAFNWVPFSYSYLHVFFDPKTVGLPKWLLLLVPLQLALIFFGPTNTLKVWNPCLKIRNDRYSSRCWNHLLPPFGLCEIFKVWLRYPVAARHDIRFRKSSPNNHIDCTLAMRRKPYKYSNITMQPPMELLQKLKKQRMPILFYNRSFKSIPRWRKGQ
jgi:uncharacterized membrane protein